MLQTVIEVGQRWQVIHGDARNCLRQLPDHSVRCCVTSPPYWALRDYGVEGQIGLEPTPEAYAASLVEVFREVRRILTDDGTLWVNLGDSYAAGAKARKAEQLKSSGLLGHPQTLLIQPTKLVSGLKPKDLVGIPWLVAFVLRTDGWYLRDDIIWHQSNSMPESVTDRTAKSHEYLFMFSKSERYHYDADAITELAKGEGVYRHVRSVWEIATSRYKGNHDATMPAELARRCILAGSEVGDHVLDPFAGSGTTLAVALEQGRRAVGVEIDGRNTSLIRRRIDGVKPSLLPVER